MNKIVTWLLGFTQVGKIVLPVQKFLSGYKVYLAGAGLAVPAVLTILTNFGDYGMSYLVEITKQPEWRMLLEGIAAMGVRAAITKGFNKAKDPNGPNA